MNIFCIIFGHTWIPETQAPDPLWSPTKSGDILTPTVDEEAVRHFDVCRRCGLREDAGARRHDADRPAAAEE
jgi:hypothetical protein